MVEDVVVCSVWTAGGGVSFSGVGCRLAGVDLVVVGGGLLAAVGWRGHSPAEGADCLPWPSSSRILKLVGSYERLVQRELDPFRRIISIDELRQS